MQIIAKGVRQSRRVVVIGLTIPEIMLLMVVPLIILLGVKLYEERQARITVERGFVEMTKAVEQLEKVSDEAIKNAMALSEESLNEPNCEDAPLLHPL